MRPLPSPSPLLLPPRVLCVQEWACVWSFVKWQKRRRTKTMLGEDEKTFRETSVWKFPASAIFQKKKTKKPQNSSLLIPSAAALPLFLYRSLSPSTYLLKSLTTELVFSASISHLRYTCTAHLWRRVPLKQPRPILDILQHYINHLLLFPTDSACDRTYDLVITTIWDPSLC